VSTFVCADRSRLDRAAILDGACIARGRAEQDSPKKNVVVFDRNRIALLHASFVTSSPEKRSDPVFECEALGIVPPMKPIRPTTLQDVRHVRFGGRVDLKEKRS
jgi:hypothetical protein